MKELQSSVCISNINALHTFFVGNVDPSLTRVTAKKFRMDVQKKVFLYENTITNFIEKETSNSKKRKPDSTPVL